MSALEKAWYRKRSWSQVLVPVACLFQLIARSRRGVQQKRYQGSAWPVPLVVIGNINVGGTGKTPLVIALTRQLGAMDIKVGIVSRGYGGSAGAQPMSVCAASTAEQCGDEALLIARRTACPVVVCTDRRAAVDYLLAENAIDMVLSDDGLQHYRMHRDLEIVVIDGQRGLGNGACLPAGPLREPPSRLNDIDGIVINGGAGWGEQTALSAFQTQHLVQTQAEVMASEVPTYVMTLKASHFVNLGSGEQVSAKQWSLGQSVHAVAGIGNPERFRDTLVALGLQPQLQSFPDHHAFTASDLDFEDDWPVIMTAKDAVKCESLCDDRYWYLDVEAVISAELIALITDKLATHKIGNVVDK